MSRENGANKTSHVVCETTDGLELHGTLLRLTRYAAVFEFYNPTAGLRLSDLIQNLRITSGEHTVYSGRALVNSIVNTGTAVVCEAGLDEAGLNVTPLSSSLEGNGLREQFREFLNDWHCVQRVRPDFKDVMGDLQGFLSDLRTWLDRIEVEIRSSPSADRQELERRIVEELGPPVTHAIDNFITRFEAIAGELEEDLRPIHRLYLRRQLHPLLLCSPFAYRTFQKPLGYAGDYEMVSMMMRSPSEGSTLFAKILNTWLLDQAPSRAHRNRVVYLRRKLVEEAVRLRSLHHPLRVFNMGCGPAAEVQHFMAEEALADNAQFTLLDFNQETLTHAQAMLEAARRAHGRSCSFRVIKRSVQQVLKEAARSVPRRADSEFDLIYCAGLFDYLSTAICKRLMNIFYEMLASGGLLVVTNVSEAMNDSRPFRHSMDYLLDWHLIYRNGPEVLALAPDAAPPEDCRVIAEETGVNIFLEVRKSRHA